MRKAGFRKGILFTALVSLLLLLWPAGMVTADEISDLKQQLNEQIQKMQNLNGQRKNSNNRR